MADTVLGFLLGFLANYILQRAKHQSDRDLEQLKVLLGSQRDLLAAMRDMLTSMISTTHSRTLDAIERTWESILRIRDLVSKYTGPYEILTREELKREDIVHKTLSVLPTATEEQWVDDIQAASGDIEKYRPFIGEKLWLLYFAYRAAALRMAWKVRQGKKRGIIPYWDETIDGKPDHHLRYVASLVLKQSELNEVFSGSTIGGPMRLLTAMEAKILEEMNHMVFGRRLVSIGIREMDQLDRIIQSMGAAHTTLDTTKDGSHTSRL